MSQTNARRNNPGKYLRPALLARLSSLELVAKSVVDGYFTGLHRSPYFGFSQEFAEYRAYNEGDDLRFIDWNVYARTDRMYIKRYHGETNTAINMLLDVSGSMGYRSADVSKLSYGKFICATLAYLAKRQHDAAGLAMFDDQIRERIPPASHPDTLYRLLGALERSSASNGTRIGPGIDQLAASVSRRGIVVVVSDFYCEPEQLVRNLQPLTQHGHEVVLFHLLDPAELAPASSLRELRSPATMTDVESGEQIKVSAGFLQHDYPQKMQRHREALERSAQRANVSYMSADTSQPLDDLLHHYLVLRQQQR